MEELSNLITFKDGRKKAINKKLITKKLLKNEVIKNTNN